MKSYSGNKTEFIRTQFSINPLTTVKEMLQKWREVSDEELNPTLYYVVKQSLGMRPGKPVNVAAPAPAVENPYLAMERSLDELSERAAQLNDVELSRTFRLCRHHCSLQLLSKSH